MERTIRKAFDRERAGMGSFEETRTQQQFLKDADINSIMKRYKVTGLLRQVSGVPMFGDFSELPDYQEALNAVIAGETAFARLPSDLRAKFDNDPARFLEYARDPENFDEMVDLGLFEPKGEEPQGRREPAEAVETSEPEATASEGA